MPIILYTTHCPMCNLLVSRLDAKGIKYETCEDVDVMTSKGFTSVPVLEIAEGQFLHTKEALKWVEEQK